MSDCDFCRYAWSTPGSMGSCPDRMELPDGGCAVEDDLPEEGYDGEGPCPCFRPHVWTEEELCEGWWEEEMEKMWKEMDERWRRSRRAPSCRCACPPPRWTASARGSSTSLRGSG